MRVVVRADQWLEEPHTTESSARENGVDLYGCVLSIFEGCPVVPDDRVLPDGDDAPSPLADALHGLIVKILDGLGTVANQIGDESVNVVSPLVQANSGRAIVYHSTEGERIPPRSRRGVRGGHPGVDSRAPGS